MTPTTPDVAQRLSANLDYSALFKQALGVSLSAADATAKTEGLPILGKEGSPSENSATAFIGGGCCVHLSVEYMLADPLSAKEGGVMITVKDSHATMMAWGTPILPKTSYQIREDIITTYAGAQLELRVMNAMARVRWCEVFSG